MMFNSFFVVRQC